ncbi:MAG: carbonic anhydrase family protein [Rhodobacteraceae bacterium]|nr:carbonic anhydrase family protein [Paracoccaceae bacterium]
MKPHSLTFCVFAAVGLVSASAAFAASDKLNWGYSGKADPSVWGELSEQFKACSIGKEQSPIDIRRVDTVRADAPAVSIHWRPFKPEAFNNGHTIQVNVPGDSFAELKGKRYDLLQFHFHHLSEHTFDGQHAKMEVHFVHKSEAGDLLVIGAMIEQGDPNSALASLWPLIPAFGKKSSSAKPIDASSLLPTTKAAFRYKGSLTTPPCSETVTWHVMIDQVGASAVQIAEFAKIYSPHHFLSLV